MLLLIFITVDSFTAMTMSLPTGLLTTALRLRLFLLSVGVDNVDESGGIGSVAKASQQPVGLWCYGQPLLQPWCGGIAFVAFGVQFMVLGGPSGAAARAHLQSSL